MLVCMCLYLCHMAHATKQLQGHKQKNASHMTLASRNAAEITSDARLMHSHIHTVTNTYTRARQIPSQVQVHSYTHTLSTLILRLICGCKCCCSWNYANFLVLYAASDTRETSNDGVEYPKPTCNMLQLSLSLPWKDHEIYKQWDLWSPVRRPAADNAALITPKWPLWWLNI